MKAPQSMMPPTTPSTMSPASTWPASCSSSTAFSLTISRFSGTMTCQMKQTRAALLEGKEHGLLAGDQPLLRHGDVPVGAGHDTPKAVTSKPHRGQTGCTVCSYETQPPPPPRPRPPR